MMMTHRIVLKTHPLFGDTRSLLPFDPIQERLASHVGTGLDGASSTLLTRVEPSERSTITPSSSVCTS
jgi:hypothetical protein